MNGALLSSLLKTSDAFKRFEKVSFQITLISDLMTETNRNLMLSFRVFYFLSSVVRGESNFNFGYNIS